MQIIAEIGQAHDGSLGMAHAFIDALADTGVDVIKFQTHIADAESSSLEQFRVNFSYEDQTRFDYWKRMEFTLTQWKELKDHCEDKGVEFMSSPFSNAAIDLLEEINVKRYKIGSGEINNYLLLDKLSRTGKSLILSSGMSSRKELDESINFLINKKTEISLLQCTTSYPTKPEQWGLNLIPIFKSQYRIPIGFSDHSGNIFACLAAVALGAEIIEFHVTFDKRMFGPDSTSSINIDQTRTLVSGIKQITTAQNNPLEKDINKEILSLKAIFEKSLSVNRDIPKGSILRFEDLEASKPSNCGLNVRDYEKLIGKKVVRTLNKNDFINIDDIED